MASTSRHSKEGTLREWSHATFADSAIDVDSTDSSVLPVSMSLHDGSPPPEPSITLSSQTRSMTPSPSPPEFRGPKTAVSLSTRLAFLSSLAVSEQAVIPSESAEALHRHLDIVQRALVSSPHEAPPAPEEPSNGVEAKPMAEDPELLTETRAILSHLTRSLETLRSRHADTLHVQGHLISELDNLATTNLSLTSQVQSLSSENASLKTSNEVLASSKTDLRTQFLELESREQLLSHRSQDLTSYLSKQNKRIHNLESYIAQSNRASLEDEVALEAMSAAVGGLEGWMDSFIEKQRTNNPPNHHHINKSPAAIRGRGRFRGRYNPHSHTIGPMSPPATPSSRKANTAPSGTDWSVVNNSTITSSSVLDDSIMTTATMTNSSQAGAEGNSLFEFEEGIRSWIKGFRDVEESIRTRIRTREEFGMRTRHNNEDEDDTSDDEVDIMEEQDDDWGDFEQPTTAQ